MFEFYKWFFSVIGVFFVIYLLGYSTFLIISVITGALELYKSNRMQMLHNELRHEYYVPVSILVPAYNEEITVVDTVNSLLKLRYHLYEVIVVDDGSKDNTSENLISAFCMKRIQRPIQKRLKCQPEEAVYEALVNGITITLVKKKNGGKADALNMGINVSSYPYFICMDADSVLQEDSLEKIVRPVLGNDNVVAVGGMVRISNYAVLKDGKLLSYHMPWNPIVGMQILEYDRSFMASRIMLDQFNGNLIISGAFGLFQKEAVMNAGGYDTNTMGEDMELVVKLHVFCQTNWLKYSIKYAPDAICWSQCPSNLKDLRKQRRRWYLGLFQTLGKHKQMICNPRFGKTGFISYIYYLLYELFSPFIELFGLITIFFAFMVKLINVPFMVIFFLIYAIYGAVLTLTAFFSRVYTQNIKLTGLDIVKALYLCLLESLCLRFIQAFTRMTAFIGYRNRKHDWGKIERQKINIEHE